MQIILDFGGFHLDAELFDTPVAQAFAGRLPLEVDLTAWGNELYGPVGADLGTYDPVQVIPVGGLAYTNQGNYFCIFFGQTPAWPVDHIGEIHGDVSVLATRQPVRVIVTAKAD